MFLLGFIEGMCIKKLKGLWAKTSLPGMKNVYDYCLKMYINHKVISHNTRQFQNELKIVVLQLRKYPMQNVPGKLITITCV